METVSPDRNVLLFRFDSSGRRRECAESGPRGPSEDLDTSLSFVGRCFRNKCVLCLLICAIVLVVVSAAAGFVLALDLSGANVTTFDHTGSAAIFYDTWEVPEDVKDKAKAYIRGDRNNLTVWFIDFGRWELDLILKSNETKHDLNTYVEQTLYRIKNEFYGHAGSQQGRNNDSNWALVVNMDGYGLSQAFDFTATAYLQELVKRHISHLRTLEYAVIINLPSWARFLTGIIKPLLGNLLDKFEIFGYQDWLPALLARFDAQELPKGYDAYVGDGDDNENKGGTSWFF